MRIKPDSTPPVEMNICSFIRDRMDRLDELMMKYTNDEVIITSGSEKDAPHMKGSKHFSGEAIDVRNWRIVVLGNTGKIAFFSGLNKLFGPALFDIVEHTTHIHIEFDPEHFRLGFPVRLKGKKEIWKKRELIPTYLPTIEFDSKFRKVVNKGYDVIKVTSNIIGRHYAGVTVFKKGKEEGILDMIRRILKEFLELIRRRQ